MLKVWRGGEVSKFTGKTKSQLKTLVTFNRVMLLTLNLEHYILHVCQKIFAA